MSNRTNEMGTGIFNPYTVELKGKSLTFKGEQPTLPGENPVGDMVYVMRVPGSHLMKLVGDHPAVKSVRHRTEKKHGTDEPELTLNLGKKVRLSAISYFADESTDQNEIINLAVSALREWLDKRLK